MREPRDRPITDLPAPHPDPLVTLALPADDWAGDRVHYLRLCATSDLHPTESNVALARHLVFRLLHRLLAKGQRPDRKLVTALCNHLKTLPGSLVQRAYLRDLLEYAQLPREWWVPALAMGLVGFAVELERSGFLHEALTNVALACRCYEGRMDTLAFVQAGLLSGRLHRRIGNWGEATQAYTAACEAARSVDDPGSALKATNGMILVLTGRGNLPEASALAEATVAEATATQLRPMIALTYGMLAAVRDRQGRPAEALAAGYRAVAWQTDPEARMHALGDLGCHLARAGNDVAARNAFELVQKKSGLWLTRTNAQIELLGLDVRSRNELSFRAAVRALVALEEKMPPSMAIDFRVQAARGWRQFGAPATADVLLHQALSIAETAQLAQWVFRIEAELRQVRGAGASESQADPTPLADARPENLEPVGSPEGQLFEP